MRSMVEREAWCRRPSTVNPDVPAASGASLTTTLRVVPLSQVGEVSPSTRSLQKCG
jgi:hypothetical protein